MKAAAQGGDENVDNKDDPDIRQLYNREHHEYPYKSHGQYLRACYALMGCSMFIFFNGWRTFVSPMSVSDFLACYIAVRPSFRLNIPRLPDILQLPQWHGVVRLAANFDLDPLLHHDLRPLPIQVWRLEPPEVAKASVQRFAGSEAASCYLGTQTRTHSVGDYGYAVHGGECEAVWEVALGLAEVMLAESGGDR